MRAGQVISRDQEQYYQLNLIDSTVRLAEFRRGKKIIARVKLDDFTLVSDLPIPAKVLIELPQDKVAIEILMVRAEINPKLAGDLFEAKIPADFKRQELKQ